MNPLKTITISGTNNTYAIPVLDIDDNVNIDLPDAGSSNGVSSEELQNHNSSSTAHEDIRAEINELSNAINGVIITVHADEWASQEDGTYTNTIAVDGIDADTTYDVNLYGEYTEEQATAFSELITSIATTDNQIIVTASESVAVELKLLLRGKIDFSDQSIVYVKDLEASRISYDNNSSNLAATDVQGALDENARYMHQFSNPNLLINGDFRVNQRGATAYNGAKYTVDRWYLYNGYLDYTSDKNILMTYNVDYSADSNSNKLIQFIETELQDGEYTVSCKIDGSIYSLNVNLNKRMNYVSDDHDKFTLSVGYETDRNTYTVFIQVKYNQVIEINWVKLELGSFATPFVPRSYAEELMMCQRYYQRYGQINVSLMIYESGIGYFNGFPLCTTMRWTPTATLDAFNIKWVNTEVNVACNASTISYFATSACDASTTGADVIGLTLDAEIY